MSERDDLGDDGERMSTRRYALMFGAGALALAVLVAGVVLLLSGDKPPRKVQEFVAVNIVPPPPPPPPAPPEQKPEDKVIDQTPVKQEIIEQKPVDTEPPPEPNDDPMPPGPPALDTTPSDGPGNFRVGPGGNGGGGGGGDASRFGWYASIVQSQIEAALRANEKTRHAVMRIQVRLWSDAMGRVTRVQLSPSTGDPALDAALRDDVLGRLVLREPPPKDMPMPIITRVTAQRPS